MGTVATAVVGLAGIAGTVWGSRVHAEGQKTIAREERHEQRLETAYLELLSEVAVAEDWSDTLFNRWTTAQEEPQPTVPAIYVNRLSTEGRLSAWWSPRMRQLVDQLQRQMRDMYSLWLRNTGPVEFASTRRDPESNGAIVLEQFIACKVEFADTVLALRNQVSAELTGMHAQRQP